ncbi:protein-disulfide reductase DsbD family protein [Leeuwenhoekiella sp. A16]|uniref:protein-disulfide reductase DsbD family protein n=1 Tax=unclassified Leeuwenhoekiella TaxID=2615029 RepID=UPI003A7FCD0F
MFKQFLLAFLLIGSYAIHAQSFTQKGKIYDPVEWEGSVEKISDTEYNLIFSAEIEKDWHIYSQFTPDGGPLPFELEFLGQPDIYNLDGPTKESETITEFSDVFNVDEIFFSEKAILTQKIALKDPKTSFVKAQISYQVCKDVCINQEFYVVFDLKSEKATIYKDYSEFEAYGAEDKTNSVKVAAIPSPEKVNEKHEKRGLLTLFLVSFLAGLTALLTPCVFPMIPMTVSYFTKRSTDKIKGKRNAILYAIFIVVIYVLLGTIVTAIFGADALNALATNVWFNLIFFALLIVFASSFFGAFEIMLPNSWANVVDKQADRGGIVGIFFMALALAIVSFSCTGPIVGTLLVEAASKGGIAPIIGMLGFSSAIAIPFGLFALFPGWMNSLPRSGGWLNSVKVVLGFLELALAFKFLSNADLVLQAHWLEREVFIAIWIAVFGVLALYLFGKIKLPHDSDLKHISVGRLVFGLIVLTFTIYLIPGLWGAPLKLISGFPPPMNYSEAPYGVGYTKTLGGIASDDDFPEHAELGAHDIVAFTDYDAGLAFAKANKKPVLLDFTGYACVNCRKMEERVWGEPQVLGKLKNDVVLISLYVDAQEDLPETDQYTSKTTGKRIKTIGNKWSDFQIKNYGANAQPYYVLLDLDEKPLLDPIGYTPDVDTYAAWLDEGITKFKN